MFDFLKRITGHHDRLEGAAKKLSGERLVKILCGADIWLLAEMQSEGLDPTESTQEEILAEMERSAKELSEMDEFRPLIYLRDGTDCLPFFSSQKHLHAFIGEYSKSRNKMFPFQAFQIKGSMLADQIQPDRVLVLNDCSPNERLLSQSELIALQQHGNEFE